MTFVIKDNLKKTPPKFHPKIIDYFSLDDTRTMCNNSSKLSYLYHRVPQKNIHYDLNEGIDIVRNRSSDPEMLNKILKWIVNNSNKILANPDCERWLQPNFICHLNLLSKIANTPFNDDTWIIQAVRWRGNIYLCLFETKEENKVKANWTKRNDRMTFWGYKFEQYMTSDSPDQPPDTSKAINRFEEFDCVLQSQLSDHFLLYTVEIDAILSDEKLVDPLPLDKLNLVELKTTKVLTNSKEKKGFIDWKFLRWWTKSFFAGIERIICGCRDDEGFLKETMHYHPPSFVQEYKPRWHGSSAINFCDAFLSHVKKHVIHDYNHTIYKFEKQKFRNDIVLTELPSIKNDLLPDWYINHESVEKSESVKRSQPVEEYKSDKKIKLK